MITTRMRLTGIETKIETNNTIYIALSVESFLLLLLQLPCLHYYYYFFFTVDLYNPKDICLDDSYIEYGNSYTDFCGSVTFSVIDHVPVCFKLYHPFSSLSKLQYCSATVEIDKKQVLVSFKWILFFHSYFRIQWPWAFVIFLESVSPSSGSYSKKCPPLKPLSQFQIKVGVNYPNEIRGRRGHDIWIYNYPCNNCLSPLKLWVWTPFILRCTQYSIIW